MPKTRAQAAQATRTASLSDSSSGLSDPPTDIEDALQNEPRQKRRVTVEEHDEQAPGPDIEMGEGVEDVPNPDLDYDPKAPRKIRRVRDIEIELRLTPEQSDQMRILINEEMKKADILGKITFSSRPKALQDEPLRAVIETAKRELRFLKDTGVEGKRLDELLLARAMINNSNEKHNVFMVKVGKVHRRAGAPMPAPPPTSTTTNVEGEVFQPDLAGHEPTPVVTIPRSASRDRQPTHRPSVLAASLNDLGIGEHADATPQEDRLLIQNPDHQAAAAPTFNLDMFHPTAFLIRVVNSTTGAAVHTSQLIPTSRRGSMIAIDDMSFDRFIELVSAQVGFDVQARTSAIMPRGGSIGPSDSKVKLVSEDSWKAVLYIVHNARMRTCEFVVEERGVEG